MKQVIITESALREILLEEMNSGYPADDSTSTIPVNVNPVIAPDAPEVDPNNNNFVPKNKTELLSALRMLCNVSDDEAPEIYITIKDSMKKQEENMGKNDVKESIRLAVRKMLAEMSSSEKKQAAADKLWSELPKVDPSKYPPVTKVPAGVSALGGEPAEKKAKFEKNKAQLQKTFQTMKMSDIEEEPTSSEPEARKNVMMSDVGGSSFKEIAKELGFAAESGAKQAVEKALAKAKFIMTMDLFNPEELEIIVLQTMSDYIDFLKSSGELDAEEVKMLKNNPGVVKELDGFREFLDKSLRKAKKAAEGSSSVEESVIKVRRKK
jgi:hypothetical protein